MMTGVLHYGTMRMSWTQPTVRLVLPSSSWDIPVMCYDCWNLQLQFSMSFFQKLLVCWWLTSVLVVVEVTDIFSRFTVRHPILLTSVNETCSTVRLSLTKTALPYWSCGRSTTSLIQWLKWGRARGEGGGLGLSPLLPFEPPAIVWAPLIESIKCYFLPK